MSGVMLVGNASKELNKLAREQMKFKLLADILIDMEICKLEGWDVTEYLLEIINMLKAHVPKQKYLDGNVNMKGTK